MRNLMPSPLQLPCRKFHEIRHLLVENTPTALWCWRLTHKAPRRQSQSYPAMGPAQNVRPSFLHMRLQAVCLFVFNGSSSASKLNSESSTGPSLSLHLVDAKLHESKLGLLAHLSVGGRSTEKMLSSPLFKMSSHSIWRVEAGVAGGSHAAVEAASSPGEHIMFVLAEVPRLGVWDVGSGPVLVAQRELPVKAKPHEALLNPSARRRSCL